MGPQGEVLKFTEKVKARIIHVVDVGDQKIVGDNKYQSWVAALFHEVTFFDFLLLQMPLDDP